MKLAPLFYIFFLQLHKKFFINLKELQYSVISWHKFLYTDAKHAYVKYSIHEHKYEYFYTPKFYNIG